MSAYKVISFVANYIPQAPPSGEIELFTYIVILGIYPFNVIIYEFTVTLLSENTYKSPPLLQVTDESASFAII